MNTTRIDSERSEKPAPLTYAGSRSVDERDVYSLVRAREECMEGVRMTINDLPAPQVRDFNAFFLRFDDVMNERVRVDDPLYFTFQVMLGLLDLEGFRYAKILWLDNPEPPQGWMEQRKEAARGSAAAEQLLAEKVSKPTPPFAEWSPRCKSEAQDFAGYVQAARALWRRYPELITSKAFPEPFRLAYQQLWPETSNPDADTCSYGDFGLVENGLLTSQDPAVERAITRKRVHEAAVPATKSKRSGAGKKSKKGGKSRKS